MVNHFSSQRMNVSLQEGNDFLVKSRMGIVDIHIIHPKIIISGLFCPVRAPLNDPRHQNNTVDGSEIPNNHCLDV